MKQKYIYHQLLASLGFERSCAYVEAILEGPVYTIPYSPERSDFHIALGVHVMLTQRRGNPIRSAEQKLLCFEGEMKSNSVCLVAA